MITDLSDCFERSSKFPRRRDLGTSIVQVSDDYMVQQERTIVISAEEVFEMTSAKYKPLRPEKNKTKTHR